eukprot:gene13473-13588_t
MKVNRTFCAGHLSFGKLGAAFGGIAMVLMVQGAFAQSAPATPAPAPLATPAAPAAPVDTPVVTPPPAATPPAPVTPPATVAPPVPATAPAPVLPKTEITPLPDQPAAVDASSTPFDLPAKPVALLRGKANWEDGYKVIHEGFKKITDALAAEKIPVIGKPLAVFVETNDQDFKYEIMMPIEKAPEGKAGLPGDIVFGMSPAGKVLRFQHRGAYDDVDSTYEAITAYLDEKGFESRDLFVEEYLNDAKGSDDTNLQVDVYVYLK